MISNVSAHIAVAYTQKPKLFIKLQPQKPFYMTYSQKLKLYVKLQPQKPKDLWKVVHHQNIKSQTHGYFLAFL